MSGSIFLASLFTVLEAYLLGNMNGAIMVSKSVYHSDVRDHGSGNAGLTNFFRSFGTKALPLVALVDIGKAVLSTLLGGCLLGSCGYAAEGKLLATLFVIVGHVYPVLYRFRGGKGVLSAFGAMLAVDVRVALAGLLLFAVIVFFTRYASLASLCAVLAGGTVICIRYKTPASCALALLSVALVFFAHRSNLQRLARGTENKLSFRK